MYIDDCQSDDCEASEHNSNSNLSADERNDTLDSENNGEQMNEFFINTESESQDQAENMKLVQKLCGNIFSDEILNIILQWINVEISSTREKYKDTNKSDLQDTDIIELRTRRHNIVLQLPGLRPSANLRYEASPEAVWKHI
ncbi:hypothetical protein QE152_g26001 [Popillia japonica]|uniref:Uncharacterized protein n=1 Tax=Popillia japonica TaxID=7064 RepID=A0AAW1JY22_POPJA